jgi:hypothetical protein
MPPLEEGARNSIARTRSRAVADPTIPPTNNWRSAFLIRPLVIRFASNSFKDRMAPDSNDWRTSSSTDMTGKLLHSCSFSRAVDDGSAHC